MMWDVVYHVELMESLFACHFHPYLYYHNLLLYLLLYEVCQNYPTPLQ